jgi:hypothetical protein
VKTYDIEVQRLKSLRHDKGLFEIGIDALVLARPAAACGCRWTTHGRCWSC